MYRGPAPQAPQASTAVSPRLNLRPHARHPWALPALSASRSMIILGLQRLLSFIIISFLFSHFSLSAGIDPMRGFFGIRAFAGF
jgi:hypothetical protein